MKTLNFTFKGELYQVNEQGYIKINNLSYFSENWVFMGGAKHHWCNSITVSLNDAFKNPSLLNGCLGFDKDHGTFRRWGGSYNGKLPRISNAYISNN